MRTKKDDIEWHLNVNSIRFKLLTMKLWKTKNERWAVRSRFQWTQSKDGKTFYLRPLGIMHYLFNLTVVYEIKDK